MESGRRKDVTLTRRRGSERELDGAAEDLILQPHSRCDAPGDKLESAGCHGVGCETTRNHNVDASATRINSAQKYYMLHHTVES